MRALYRNYACSREAPIIAKIMPAYILGTRLLKVQGRSLHVCNFLQMYSPNFVYGSMCMERLGLEVVNFEAASFHNIYRYW